MSTPKLVSTVQPCHHCIVIDGNIGPFDVLFSAPRTCPICGVLVTGLKQLVNMELDDDDGDADQAQA